MRKLSLLTRKLTALVMALILTFSAAPAGAASDGSSLGNAYLSLLESTLDTIEETASLVNGDAELFDVLVQAGEQIANLVNVAAHTALELYSMTDQKIDALYGRYLALMNDHASSMNLVAKYVVSDVRNYGTVKQQSTIDKLTAMASSVYASYTGFRDSATEFRDSVGFVLLGTPKEKELIDHIIESSAEVFDAGQHVYGARYTYCHDQYIARAPQPSVTGGSISMTSQVTGVPIALTVSARSFSKLSYSIQWYKDDVLQATLTNPTATYSESTLGIYTGTAKLSYTPGAAGAWHAKVTVTDKLGRTAAYTTGKLTVSQTAVNPTKLTMSTSGATLGKGKTLQLSVSYTPTNTTQKGLTWTSSNTNVATVSSSGLVTAVGEGTATIKAVSTANTALSCSATINVSGYYESLYMSNIGTTNAQINCQLTAEYYLTECGFYIGASAGNLSTKKVESLGSGASVLKIWYDMNKWGVTLQPGATYYYKFYIVYGGVTYYSSVQSFRTLDIPVTGISLPAGPIAMEKGESQTLALTVAPSNATSGRDVTWQSSSPDVVSVSDSGAITALDGGTATITATTVANSSIAASVVVNVHDPADDVVLTAFAPAVDAACVGDTVVYEATLTGDTSDVTYSYTLYLDGEVFEAFSDSSEPSCAFLLSVPGVYQAAVAVSAANGLHEMRSSELSVGYRYTDLTASRSSVVAKAGATVRINFTVSPSNAALIEDRGTLSMLSTQPSVASVTPGSNAEKGALYGDLTLSAPGWTTIYADAGISGDGRAAIDVRVTDGSSLILPDSAAVVDAEAFMGASGFTNVHIFGDSDVSIGARAFANCADLEVVCLGDNVTQIAADAFDGSDVTIYCAYGSAAYEFALDNSIPVLIVKN